MPSPEPTIADLLAHRTPRPVDDWYRITAQAADPGSPSRAKINIYDAIGGWFGQLASEFVTELDALDVDEIDLHINSPGGAIWDGLAIMNSLKAHRARVLVTVDGLAASAASIVAMAGDEVVMAEGSQMMIHKASGGAWGNSGFLRQTAAILDKIDVNMAAVYARRAGGDPAGWLELMDAETWYDAEEAVAAGLADRAGQPAEPADARASFDLSIFAYAGRVNAPAPMPVGVAAVARHAHAQAAPQHTPVSPEPGTPIHLEDDMSFETLMAGLRERLGVPDAADEATVLAAVDALAGRDTGHTTPPDGVVMIDADMLAELQAAAADGRAARAQQATERRAQLVATAINEGRIPPARREHWIAQLDADEEGAAVVLAALAPNTIPLTPTGTTGGISETSDDDLNYELLYGRA